MINCGFIKATVANICDVLKSAVALCGWNSLSCRRLVDTQGFICLIFSYCIDNTHKLWHNVISKLNANLIFSSFCVCCIVTEMRSVFLLSDGSIWLFLIEDESSITHSEMMNMPKKLSVDFTLPLPPQKVELDKNKILDKLISVDINNTTMNS